MTICYYFKTFDKTNHGCSIQEHILTLPHFHFTTLSLIKWKCWTSFMDQFLHCLSKHIYAWSAIMIGQSGCFTWNVLVSFLHCYYEWPKWCYFTLYTTYDWSHWTMTNLMTLLHLLVDNLRMKNRCCQKEDGIWRHCYLREIFYPQPT